MNATTSIISEKFPKIIHAFEAHQDISSTLILGVVGLLITALLSATLDIKLNEIVLFCWNCFFKPFLPSSRKRSKTGHQQQALEAFYEAQAKIYDATRPALLKGREECLELIKSHLTKTKDLVWIDLGGGTGYNVEKMNEILPLKEHFKAIFIVDLSPSLLQVARERFAAQGFTNIHCLLSDVCTFSIDYASADLITFSYSLSMIPSFHSAVDHASTMLGKDGLIASVDFGTQSDATTIGRVNTVGGLLNRSNPWILRTFWRTWFEADSVFLDPARRGYLEYKFGTIKSLNLYNNMLGRIPYYIWLGCDKTRSPALLYRINALATESPYLAPQDIPEEEKQNMKVSKSQEAAIGNASKNIPYPSIYYQRNIYRVYYDEQKSMYKQFKGQYIYAFTWEDPKEDNRILHFSKNDSVLAITSAGDNILSYAALPTPPRRIHCVDMNPYQGHLFELKLAALKSLTWEEVWKMFGLGKIDNFQELLVQKLAPHMTSNAFQYWHKIGTKTFNPKKDGFYFTGFSKWPLKLTRFVFKITGASDYVDELCASDTLEQQKKLWETKLRPKLLNPIISELLVGNPIFLWKALGVPANQASLMGSSIIEYVANTLDPVVNRYKISNENYFYYLCLKGHYSKNNCPDYLKKQVYKKFHSANSILSNIRIHTDTIQDVAARLTKHSLTIAIIMDHMDWFPKDGKLAIEEIQALSDALAPGGRVLLRSASKKPWYIETFESYGFMCKPEGIRKDKMAIDMVNMYASTWLCQKMESRGRNMSTLEL